MGMTMGSALSANAIMGAVANKDVANSRFPSNFFPSDFFPSNRLSCFMSSSLDLRPV